MPVGESEGVTTVHGTLVLGWNNKEKEPVKIHLWILNYPGKNTSTRERNGDVVDKNRRARGVFAPIQKRGGRRGEDCVLLWTSTLRQPDKGERNVLPPIRKREL